MRRAIRALGVTVSLLWLAGASAQAEPIRWRASGGAASYPDQRNAVFTGGGSSQSGIEFQPGPETVGTDSGDVVLTTLRTFDFSPPDFPHHHEMSGPLGNYQAGILLRDLASGAEGSLSFLGNLSGEFGPSQANIVNVFTGPTTQELTLGWNRYTVTVGPFVPPGPLDTLDSNEDLFGSQRGSLSAHIEVSPVDGGVNPTPEPSCLVLAGVGLAGLGLTRWCRRFAPRAAR